MSAPDLPAPTEQGKALAALLGGKSVTVTDGSMSDLEALVAKLKSESERTRFLRRRNPRLSQDWRSRRS